MCPNARASSMLRDLAAGNCMVAMALSGEEISLSCSQNCQDNQIELIIKAFNYLTKKEYPLLADKNDNIVDAAQILLKKVCPIQGLQKVSLGLTLIFEVQRGEFIQILNTGAGHWVTISTIGTNHPVVNIYDSVYSTTCDELQRQIASILITPHSSIILHFMDVQFQSGSSDCGLFAIAYATALVFGEMPQKFCFDQKKLRSHLFKCLENKNVTLFPTLRKRRIRQSMIKAIQEVAIHCRMPEMGKFMIECTNCKQ